jgi:hypothetical protein
MFLEVNGNEEDDRALAWLGWAGLVGLVGPV